MCLDAGRVAQFIRGQYRQKIHPKIIDQAEKEYRKLADQKLLILIIFDTCYLLRYKKNSGVFKTT